MLINEMGLKQLVVTATIVQSRILVIWCHFPKMSKMSILMELMTQGDTIKLGTFPHRVSLG